MNNQLSTQTFPPVAGQRKPEADVMSDRELLGRAQVMVRRVLDQLETDNSRLAALPSKQGSPNQEAFLCPLRSAYRASRSLPMPL